MLTSSDLYFHGLIRSDYEEDLPQWESFSGPPVRKGYLCAGYPIAILSSNKLEFRDTEGKTQAIHLIGEIK